MQNLNVSIPQAVGTVATFVDQDNQPLLTVEFQYRKR